MISIAQVLKEINITVDSGQPVYFSITYVKKNGQIKKVDKAQVSVKNKPAAKPGARRKFEQNLKERNELLIYNHDDQQYNSVLIPLIISFNSTTVWH
jgi:major membrane immunogen (membrane-anchored lipoprotein)